MWRYSRSFNTHFVITAQKICDQSENIYRSWSLPLVSSSGSLPLLSCWHSFRARRSASKLQEYLCGLCCLHHLHVLRPAKIATAWWLHLVIIMNNSFAEEIWLLRTKKGVHLVHPRFYFFRDPNQFIVKCFVNTTLRSTSTLPPTSKPMSSSAYTSDAYTVWGYSPLRFVWGYSLLGFVHHNSDEQPHRNHFLRCNMLSNEKQRLEHLLRRKNPLSWSQSAWFIHLWDVRI